MPLLVAAGLQEPDVFAADMRESQEIGRLAVWFDCDALLVPSARHPRNNLVVFPSRAASEYCLSRLSNESVTIGEMSAFYEACLWICSVAFLASMPPLLAVRARQPRRLPWWAVFILAAIFGWIFFKAYAYFEYQKNEAIRDEFNREYNAYALMDFFVAAPPSIALRWGWVTGLTYLGVCLGVYGLFPGGSTAGVSRPLVGFLGAAVALAALLNCPPWSEFLTLPPFDFVAAYSYFLVCAGVSYHLLRALRWEKAGYPFAVMFLVDFLILCTVDCLHSWTAQFSKMAEWAAMFGAVFTLLWWIAIRRRVPASTPDR